MLEEGQRPRATAKAPGPGSTGGGATPRARKRRAIRWPEHGPPADAVTLGSPERTPTVRPSPSLEEAGGSPPAPGRGKRAVKSEVSVPGGAKAASRTRQAAPRVTPEAPAVGQEVPATEREASDAGQALPGAGQAVIEAGPEAPEAAPPAPPMGASSAAAIAAAMGAAAARNPWLQPRVLVAAALGFIAGLVVHAALGPAEPARPSGASSQAISRPSTDRARAPAGAPIGPPVPYAPEQSSAGPYYPPGGERLDLYRNPEAEASGRSAPGGPAGPGWGAPQMDRAGAYGGGGWGSSEGYPYRGPQGESGPTRPWSSTEPPGGRPPARSGDSQYPGFYAAPAGPLGTPGYGYDPWGAPSGQTPRTGGTRWP